MGTPVPAHEVPTAEVRPSPTRVPPRETNPRRPSLVCEHPTHPPLPSSSPQLPEESELTWDCGDAYPEPALDVVPPHIVKPAEAAAYLFGGLGVFYGPIVGAIVVSLMNSMLSDYTEASILYVGLVFLAIVMFAPRGLGGGIEHVRVAAREGTLGKRLPGWLTGAVAVVLISLGLVLLIELLFQWRHGDDEFAQFFGLNFVAESVMSWVWALILFGAGVAVMRVTKKFREDNA